MRTFRALALAALACFGCATDIQRHARPVELSPSLTSSKIEVLEEVRFRLAKGSVRDPIGAGSTWRSVGTIPEGTVYAPLGDTLLVRTGHAYEAYIVVSSELLTGVYLPVEDSFVETREPVTLNWKVMP